MPCNGCASLKKQGYGCSFSMIRRRIAPDIADILVWFSFVCTFVFIKCGCETKDASGQWRHCHIYCIFDIFNYFKLTSDRTYWANLHTEVNRSLDGRIPVAVDILGHVSPICKVPGAPTTPRCCLHTNDGVNESLANGLVGNPILDRVISKPLTPPATDPVEKYSGVPPPRPVTLAGGVSGLWEGAKEPSLSVMLRNLSLYEWWRSGGTQVV